jgi:AcrR family transcriptional regulator
MPLPRYGRLDPERQRHLMDVAIARFAEKGYEAASLNEILAAAGFGKSSYYYYFADKEDLFATVLEDLWARVEKEIPHVSLEGIDAASYWPRIEQGFAALAAIGARHLDLIAFARDIRSFWFNPTPRIKPIIERVHAWQRTLLELGRSLGTVRTDIDLEWLLAITEAADQAVDERLVAQRAVTPEALQEHARMAFDTFRRLVEPGGGPGRLATETSRAPPRKGGGGGRK